MELNEDPNYMTTYVLQEKTVKILDIWTKANTFPPAVMTRLIGLTQTGETSGSAQNGVDITNKSCTFAEYHLANLIPVLPPTVEAAIVSRN